MTNNLNIKVFLSLTVLIGVWALGWACYYAYFLIDAYHGHRVYSAFHPAFWGLVGTHGIIFFLSAALISFVKKDKLNDVLLAYLVLSVVAILVFAGDKSSLAQALISGSLFFIMIFGGLWVLKVLTGRIFPFYGGAVSVFCVTGLVFFILGIFHLATPLSRHIAIGISLILGWVSFLKFGREFFISKVNIFRGMNLSELFWLEGLFLLALITFSGVTLPDYCWDSTGIHTPMIQSFLRDNGYSFRSFTHSDYLNPVFYAMMSVPFGLSGYIGTKMVVWILGMLLVAAVVDAGKLIGLPRAFALGAAFIFLSLPNYSFHYGFTIYLDMPITFFCVSAFSLTLQCIQKSPIEKNLQLLYLFLGAAIGMAVVIKLNGVVFITALALCILIGSSRMELKRLFPWIMLGAITVSFPHFIVTAHWTGNPFFPAFESYFKSYFAEVSVKPAGLPGYSLAQKLVLPYSFTFNSSYIVDEGFNGVIGPFFLMLFPFLFIGIYRNKRSWWPVFIAAFYFLIQDLFEGINHIRHLFCVVPLVAIAISQGIYYTAETLEVYRSRLKSLGWILVLSLIFISLAVYSVMGYVDRDYFKKSTYFSRLTEYYDFHGLDRYIAFAKNLPDETRIADVNWAIASHLPRPSYFFTTDYLEWSLGDDWRNHPGIFENILRNDYDLWVTKFREIKNSLYSDFGFESAERLLYTADDYCTFFVNDSLLPNPGVSVATPLDFVETGAWEILNPGVGEYFALFLRVFADTLEVPIASVILSPGKDNLVVIPRVYRVEGKYFIPLHMPIPRETETITVLLSGENTQVVSGGAYFPEHAYYKKEKRQIVSNIEIPVALGDSGWYRFPGEGEIAKDKAVTKVLSEMVLPGDLSTWYQFPGPGQLDMKTTHGIPTDNNHWLRYSFEVPRGANRFAVRMQLHSFNQKTIVDVDYQRLDDTGKIVEVNRIPIIVDPDSAAYVANLILVSSKERDERWNLIVWPEVGYPPLILNAGELIVAEEEVTGLASNVGHWLRSGIIDIPDSSDCHLSVNVGLDLESASDSVDIDLHKIDPLTNEIISVFRNSILCIKGEHTYVVEYELVFDKPLKDYEYRLILWPKKSSSVWMTDCSVIVSTDQTGRD